MDHDTHTHGWCIVDGCDKPADGWKGMCKSHYNKDWYQKNRERHLESVRRYREKKEREKKVVGLGPEKPARAEEGQKTRRVCLRCENPFWSEGNHNRICPSCRAINENIAAMFGDVAMEGVKDAF